MKRKTLNSKEIDNNIKIVVEEIAKLSDKQTWHIQNLTRIGVALSSVNNLEKIFNLILEEGIAFTNADASTIYKVSDDKKSLDFVLVYTKSLNLKMGGNKKPITWQSIPLYDKRNRPQLKYIVTNVYHKKRLLCFEDVYETKDYYIAGTKAIDEQNNYRSKSLLTIPLKNHEDEVLGVLQIINALDPHGKIIAFKDEHIVMLKSLAAQAAIAMSNRKLINDLETLLLQFMHSIAKGIERKSKYSSNHIIRVASLTDMIARQINADVSEKYREIFLSENELKELSMAGLMHDVGKIVTPEHVMDKSTKLETVIDRIELVKLRFELFKKALLLYKQELGEALILKIAKQWYPDSIIKSVSDILRQIDSDIIFLKDVNNGGEYLSDKAMERISQILKIEFDYDSQNWKLITEDEYNHLTIRRGTLSAEERKIINEHVQVTWEMLSELTFPNKYKNVALYASSHHEKLNGKGYPQGLNAKNLPLQSRILAIADICEALTAADRPYKKGNKLSEAIKILAECAKNKEIDGDLLDLMLDSGLYLKFAKQYLKPEQIDEVDIRAIKKIYHPELKH
ncbi:MAG: HD domain-containing phosphohydrolase [Candidatus Cloacimonadaceae bacterium]